MTPRIGIRTIVVTLGVIVCLVAIVAVLSALDAGRKAKGAKAGETLAEGRTAAAQDASTIRDGNDAANSSTRSEVKDAQDEVRHAPPADRDRIARQRLCQLNPGACAP